MNFELRAVLSLLLLFFLIKSGTGQSGCTDPQALNYESAAIENNGSCEYPKTDYVPICLGKLPDELPECSGLQYFDNQLWALNDGGNEPVVYQIDTANGEVLKSVWIENATNIDFEDMAQDSTYLYVGDFGNNSGTRKNLHILKIKKSDLNEDTVVAEKIHFSFADQSDFTSRQQAHNFDCEAFLFKNDSLYLFSKNWTNHKTKLYVLPTIPGDYVLEPIEEFFTDGLVTGADISPDGKRTTLICYNETGRTFLWLFFDYKDFSPFSGNKRLIEIGSVINRGQAEALTFHNETEGFIGSEDISIIEGKLMHFKIKQWVENSDTDTENILAQRSILHFYPNPFTDELLVDVKIRDKRIRKIELYNEAGQRVLKKRKRLRKRIRINGSKLVPGMYIMKIFLQKGGVLTEQIVKL